MTNHRRRRKPNYPPEFQALLDKARKAEGPSAPRKHHLVPASYLRRWADDKLIRVRDLERDRSYLAAPEQAARETDYYSMASPDIDPTEVPPLLFETLLGELEGRAVGTIDKLLIMQPWEIPSEEMAYFTWYLSFQVTRGHAYRQQMTFITNDYFRLLYSEITDEGLLKILRKNAAPATAEDVAAARRGVEDLLAGRLEIRQQDAALVGSSAESAGALGSALLSRDWQVYKTPKTLITCDEPVVRIGGPGDKRDERLGLGVAPILVFPLSPEALLVMSKDADRLRPPYELDPIECSEINREILASASRWAFERASKRHTELLQVPLRFPQLKREGPLPMAEGQEHHELYRIYSPTRWAGEEHPPPWPVSRWFP